MTRVSTLVGSLGGGRYSKRARHEIDVVALFDRCRSMLGAIRLLLAHNFVHEAVILGRPLFTDSLALAELASIDEKRRGDLVIGWELGSLDALEGILRDDESRGVDQSDGLAKVAERRSEVEAYARREGFRTRRWQPDDHAKALADKHGRGDEYSALLLTHLFVHGTTLATAQRYSQVAEDAVEIGGPAVELRVWANDAGLFAAVSTLYAARAICQILGWEEPPELETLLAECEARAERLRNA
jgi:hypothetical protein